LIVWRAGKPGRERVGEEKNLAIGRGIVAHAGVGDFKDRPRRQAAMNRLQHKRVAWGTAEKNVSGSWEKKQSR